MSWPCLASKARTAETWGPHKSQISAIVSDAAAPTWHHQSHLKSHTHAVVTLYSISMESASSSWALISTLFLSCVKWPFRQSSSVQLIPHVSAFRCCQSALGLSRARYLSNHHTWILFHAINRIGEQTQNVCGILHSWKPHPCDTPVPPNCRFRTFLFSVPSPFPLFTPTATLAHTIATIRAINEKNKASHPGQ